MAIAYISETKIFRYYVGLLHNCIYFFICRGIYKRLSDRQRKRNIKRKVSDLVKLVDLEKKREKTYATSTSAIHCQSTILTQSNHNIQNEFASPEIIPCTSSRVNHSMYKFPS